MNGCCGPGCVTTLGEEFDVDYREQKDGVTIEVRPRDRDKVQALKDYLKSSRELFGSCC